MRPRQNLLSANIVLALVFCLGQDTRAQRVNLETPEVPLAESSPIALSSPPVPAGVDFSGLVKVTRTIEKSFPFPNGGAIKVSTSYGNVRVVGWNERVARVRAEIHAGAAEREQAIALAEQITVDTVADERGVQIKTIYPAGSSDGRVGYEVNYEITVPNDLRVALENAFGDIYAKGLAGELAIHSRYGVVGLSQLSGPVSVHAEGQFPLSARELSGGGAFTLRGSNAEFSGLGGDVTISNHMGRTEIRDLAPSVNLDLHGESAETHVHVNTDTAPDLTATAIFGAIDAPFATTRNSQANREVVRLSNPGARQRISLHSSFGPIHLHEASPDFHTAESARTRTDLYTDVTSGSYEVDENLELVIHAIPGDILVEGIDDTTVQIRAKREVRVAAAENALFALEALNLQVKPGKKKMQITSRVLEDMSALGCHGHRMNLVIQCPRTATVRIIATEGLTAVGDTGGPVTINQKAGAIRVEHAKGPLDLTMGHGAVTVTDCAGPLNINGAGGPINLKKIYGDVTVTAAQAKTIVDSPHGGLTVESTGGDVVVLALAGVVRDYDLHVEDANLSIVIPKEASAALQAHAEQGLVHSRIPLTGAIEAEHRRYSGTINGGERNVQLSATRGNIVID